MADSQPEEEGKLRIEDLVQLADERNRKRNRRWRLIALVLAVALLCGVSFWNERRSEPLLPTWRQVFSVFGLTGEEKQLQVPEGQLRIDFLDVGNADASVIRQGACTLLIDAGKDQNAEKIFSYLDAAGVKKLDYVIVTHFDDDHIGGMERVLRRFPPDLLIWSLSYKTPSTALSQALIQTIEEQSIPVVKAVPGTVYPLGEAELLLLGPSFDYEDDNNASVVCRVAFGTRGFLFMGDAALKAEQDTMELWGDRLPSDLIKVGHHGSSDSSNIHFLRKVAPQYAVLTCGEGNPYGHPHAQLLRRLSSCDI